MVPISTKSISGMQCTWIPVDDGCSNGFDHGFDCIPSVGLFYVS